VIGEGALAATTSKRDATKSALAKRALGTGRGSQPQRQNLWAETVDFVDQVEIEDQIKQLAGSDFESFERLPQLIARFEKRMKEEAQSLKFEKAAEYRDKVKRLKVLSLSLK
jgi:excinuclease UvrABC helicase subunit UvrB